MDTEIGLLVLAVIVNFLVALATAFAAGAAWRSAAISRRALTASLAHQRRQTTLEHVSARQQTYRDLTERIGELNGDATEDQWACLLRLFGIWEHTAAGVTAGILDIEVLNKMTGGNLLGQYQRYARFIRQRRRTNPRIYDQLEIVVDRLLQMQASGHRISTDALKELKILGVDEEIYKRLREDLPTDRALEYHELVSHLFENGLEREKSLIAEKTRVPLYTIGAYPHGLSTEVVELFERVYKATNHTYPPQSRVAAEGGIERWLRLPPTHQRLAARRSGVLVAYMEIEDLADVDPQQDDVDGKRADYWHRALGGLEVPLDRLMVPKRLVVDPGEQGRGIGRLLLRHGVHTIQFVHKKVAALVVLDTLDRAISLYESEGATCIGRYSGHSGDTLRAYIF